MSRIPFLVLSLFIIHKANGQTTTPVVFNINAMLPTSPEAAMLGRFGDIPVGTYTGTADISIPIYIIKESNIEVPITLQYHSSGIKVEDQATNVGLGWLLEPGGSIIQVVNGKQDNLDHIVTSDSAGYAYLKGRIVSGVYSQTGEVGLNLWNCPCGVANDGHGDSHATLTNALDGDGQPDIYQYQFPGFSGKFYVNPETHQVVLIDQKGKVNIVRSDSAWVATTLDGNKFYFSALEAATTFSSDPTGYTWKLTSIVLNNGKTIHFTYSPGHYNWYTYYETYHDSYPLGLNSSDDFFLKPHLDFSRSTTQTLTSITTDNVTVNFNQELRADISDSVTRVKSIDIIDPGNGKKIKTFNLFYDYFPYSTIGNSLFTSTGGLSSALLDTLGKRLRLDSVQETGYVNADTLKNPAYKFLYDSTITLPLKTSFARDFWGYYNGQNNTTLIPDLSYFYYSGDSLYQNLPTWILNSSYFTGANRIPDTAKMKAALLKRIIYPTGGYTVSPR